MTDDSRKSALIIEQVPTLTDELQETLRILSAEHGVDTYTTRQRMLGGGLAHLGSGPHEKVSAIASLLEKATVKTWIIRPTPPRFGPQRIRALEVRGDEILFSTSQGTTRMARGTRTIGILADISGKVVDKQLKRLMVQNIYQGTTENARLDGDEIRRAIFMSQPVYDILLIDDERKISAILRALPGKFDPRGLGEKATLSARGNLEALVELTGKFSDNFTLRTDFGISQLPGCQLKKEIDGSDWQLQNLKIVTRFGWLMADLALQPQDHRPKPVGQEGPTVGSVAAATLFGRPELATAGTFGEIPGIGEVIEEIDRAVAGGDEISKQPKPKAGKSLPAPPEPRRRALPWRLIGLNAAGGLFILGLFFFAEIVRWPALMHYGFDTGLLPALAGAGLFWGGANFFLLKRHIENTPTSRIRSLAMGMVEIHGRARRKFALVAPMTQTPCIYYRLLKYRREEKGTWRMTSETDSGHVPFYIEDDTGRVTVDPHKATIRAGEKQEGVPGMGNILLGGGRTSDSNEKWVEIVIHEGTSLYILGDARHQKLARPSLRDRKIEKLRDLKVDRAALQKYDTDGDGRIGAEEWQAAREDVEAQVLHESLSETITPARQEDYIVIGRSKHRSHPFVIAATRSEAHLTRHYGLYSILFLTGSLLFGIWALNKAFNFFGVL